MVAASTAGPALAQVDLIFIDGFDFPPTSETAAQLQLARLTPDGVTSLPVVAVPVTYVVPQIGLDPAGFVLQATGEGPALLVLVDPATLSPSPAPGDRISLTITTMGTRSGLRAVTSLTDYSRVGRGFPVQALAQPVSNVPDLVTSLDLFESEMVSLQGLITGAFVASGSGFLSAPIDTAAVIGSPWLELRLPSAVAAAADLAPQCVFSLGPTPLGRTGSTAQASAWALGEVTPLSCPAPRVVAAVAASATQVLVSFDRSLDPASVEPGGGQFTFSGGLAATAASSGGRTVLVTSTAQAPGAAYEVFVAASVHDTLGAGVDPLHASAPFAGFVPPAAVLVNEVNANLAGSADLVELLVTGVGATSGIALVQNPGATGAVTLATLPAAPVAVGDRIVVHLNPGAGIVSETSSTAQCTDPGCYPGAWDVTGGATGITYTNQVLALAAPVSGALLDAVAFVRPPNVPPAFLEALAYVQGLGRWSPSTCGGSPCTYSSSPTAYAISVDWTGLGTSPPGTSAQRQAGANTQTAGDWTLGASTFGVPNP